MAFAAVAILVSPSSKQGQIEAGGPAIVINLQDPKGQAPARPDGEPRSEPHGDQTIPPPQAADVTNALIAADGTVVVEPALIEQTAGGPLPKIAADGRKPMDVYAARFDASDPRPRVSIIVTGLGISDMVTQQAIDQLPPGTTLSFSPYGQNLQNWTAAARAKGHEVVLEVAMEPFDYPENDPGPQALMTGAAGADNSARLAWHLSRFSGYAGIVNIQGGKLMASAAELKPVLAQLAQRGLYMADIGMSQRSVALEVAKEFSSAFARAQVQIDKTPSGDGIDGALETIANLALERRVAIGVTLAAPGTIDRIAKWAQTLDSKGVAYAPLSAAIPMAGSAAQ